MASQFEKSILVSNGVHNKLKLIRIYHGMRSMNSIIAYLVKKEYERIINGKAEPLSQRTLTYFERAQVLPLLYQMKEGKAKNDFIVRIGYDKRLDS